MMRYFKVAILMACNKLAMLQFFQSGPLIFRPQQTIPETSGFTLNFVLEGLNILFLGGGGEGLNIFLPSIGG